MIRWIRTFWYVLTLRCEEADRLRSIEREGELSRSQRVGESLHRGLCKSCRKARRQAKLLKQALSEMSDLGEFERGPRLDDASRARIAAAMADKKN